MTNPVSKSFIRKGFGFSEVTAVTRLSRGWLIRTSLIAGNHSLSSPTRLSPLACSAASIFIEGDALASHETFCPPGAIEVVPEAESK